MPLAADLGAVLVVVVGAVGEHPLRPLAGPAAAAADRRDRLDQRHELGDIVAVAAGQRHRQRDAVRLGDQVVLGARPGTVDRARARFGPPFSARTWELSITARDQSIAPAAFSSGQQRLVQPLPHPGLLPVPQPPPRGHARPEPQPLGQRTPTGCRCTGQTGCPTAPCGHRAACGQGGQRGAGRPAAGARCVPITRPGRSTVAADPSSQAGSTTTPSSVFPHVILLAVLRAESAGGEAAIPPGEDGRASRSGNPASGWVACRPGCLCCQTVQSAWVGDRRAARMAGSSPARAPMMTVAARPPAQAWGGMTTASPWPRA